MSTSLSDIFRDIANSIRSKTGSSDLITPVNMANAINNISGGSGGGTYDHAIIVVDDTNSVTDVIAKSAGIKGFLQDAYGYNATQTKSWSGDVTIGKYVTTIDSLFTDTSFNAPVTISNRITSMQKAFMCCYNLNCPITFESRESTDKVFMNQAFANALNFNQPTIIPPFNNCENLFASCYNLNQKITFPLIVSTTGVHLTGAFRNCRNFNQEVELNFEDSQVNRALDLYSFFDNCTNFSNALIIRNTNNVRIGVSGLFSGTNNKKPKYVYCKNLTNFLATSATNSVVYNTITWTAIDNGYYNATYNIYLYNNVD